MPNAPKQHSSLSYSKWDAIDSDDDAEEIGPKDKKPIEAVLESNKAPADLERDYKTQAKFADYHKKYFKGDKKKTLVAEEHRDLMARWISICDKGKEQSNTHRYSELTKFCAQYKDPCFKLEFVSGLCELHRCILDGQANPNDNSPEMKDCQLIMEAINSIEACRRFDNVALLFEMVCQPSSSDRAKKVTEYYVKNEFAKRAMMRHIFKAMDSYNQFADEQEDEYEALINPEAVKPGSSMRRKKASQDELGFGNSGEVWILVAAGTVLLLAVGLGVWAWWTLKSYDLSLSPAKRMASTAAAGSHDEV